ncbi:unnamed protein product [Bathycoccus prasinos]
MPWDDVLDFDVDGMLALADHLFYPTIDDEYVSNEEEDTKEIPKFLNNFSPMWSQNHPIDALAKRVLRCEIRADTNVSDQENVVLMMHLCKILQVALERALTTAEKSNEDDYYYSRKERENELLKEKVEEQKREFLILSKEMREVEMEFVKRIEMLEKGDARKRDGYLLPLLLDDDDAKPKKMFRLAANEEDEDTGGGDDDDDDQMIEGEHFFSTPRKEKRAIVNAKKREADLYEKEQHEEALRRAQHRALALETQSDALSDNLEESRREIRKLQKMLAEERERNEEMENRQMVLNKRLMMQPPTSSFTSLVGTSVSPSSPAKKGSAYRLGSGKNRMPPPQTVEKTKRILGYEDDQNENAMALTREETLNRWDARAQFKIAMDQLRRDLSVKSAQYDACSAKCEAQSRVLSKTVKERDELKDETKRLQRTVEKSKRIGEETVEHIRRDAEEKEERDKRLMREAVSSLRQKVRQLERERDGSREELSETTQSLEKMKQKASKAMEKNTRLQKETTDLRFQIEKLQDQLQRTVDLYEHETLKVELDRATERTKKLQLALDKETKSSAEEIERLELDIEKFEKQAALAQKRKELETVQSSVHSKEEAFHNAEKQQQLETLEIAETLLKYERENQKLKAELAALDPKFFEEVFECKERCKKRGLVIQKYEMKLRSYCETLGFAFKREPWD